jgi:hypothetical protein
LCHRQAIGKNQQGFPFFRCKLNPQSVGKGAFQTFFPARSLIV